MRSEVLGGIALLFSVGVLFQILGCVLYDNWWPLLTAVMYVILPMPALFFSSGASSEYRLMSDGDGWEDAGKFLTGFSAVGSVAIPAILYHGALIQFGAMMLEFVAFTFLCVAIVLFQRCSSADIGDDILWS